MNSLQNPYPDAKFTTMLGSVFRVLIWICKEGSAELGTSRLAQHESGPGGHGLVPDPPGQNCRRNVEGFQLQADEFSEEICPCENCEEQTTTYLDDE